MTGNNPSEILGIFGTFGNSNPNLFLINPNGILLGKDASLDVQGSFVGTTANGIPKCTRMECTTNSRVFGLGRTDGKADDSTLAIFLG